MAFAVGHISGGILTRRSLLVYGLADVFRQKNRWLRNCPGCRRYCCSGAAVLIASGKTGFDAAASGFASNGMASIHQAVIPCFPRW